MSDCYPKDKTAVNINAKRDMNLTLNNFQEDSQFAHALEKTRDYEKQNYSDDEPLPWFTLVFTGILRMGLFVSCSLFWTRSIEYWLNKSMKVAIVEDDAKNLLKPGVVERVICSGELMGLIEGEKDHYTPKTTMDSLAFMQFSSGTTGEPKSVNYSHRSVGIVAFRMKYVVGIRPGDIYLCPSSPAWGHGLWYGCRSSCFLNYYYNLLRSFWISVDGMEKFNITKCLPTDVPTIMRKT